jgi:hypothetical protein
MGIKPEKVSASIPQTNRKISRLRSTARTLKGRTKTAMNMMTRQISACKISSIQILLERGTCKSIESSVAKPEQTRKNRTVTTEHQRMYPVI